MDEALRSELEAAAAAAENTTTLAGALRPAGSLEGSPEEPFVVAMSYSLLPEGSERRSRAETPFGSMLAGDGWQFPPPLAEVPEGMVNTWVLAMPQLTEPFWRARLGDLLWTIKAGERPHESAQAAIAAYIELAAPDRVSPMERVHGLVRAHELARELSDTRRQEQVLDATRQLAEKDLGSEAGGPGVTLRLIESMLRAPHDLIEDVPALLERTNDVYGDDPWIGESIDELRSQFAAGGDEAEIRERQVQRWRDHAARAEGLLKATWLSKALDHARRHNLVEAADEIRIELEELSPEDLDLKEISAETSIPQEEIQRFLDSIVGSDDIGSALTRLGSQPPPGGARSELIDDTKRLMDEQPIAFLFTQVVMAPGSAAPLFHADTDEKKLRLAIAQGRQQAALIWGHIAVDVFTAIRDRYAPIDSDRLTELFTTDLIDVELAERIGRAFELHWNGQSDEAAHVLLPRIEAVIRSLARNLGIPIVHEPRPGREVGGYSTLGVLLSDLEGAFDDDTWRAYLQDLLVEPLSLNVRNDVLHGLTGRVAAPTAALLLHAACWLRLLGLKPKSEAAGRG